MAGTNGQNRDLLSGTGSGFYAFAVTWGDITQFTLRTLGWMMRPLRRGTILPNFYQIGVRSVPVVGITGLFIGMVLAVQSYGELAKLPNMRGWLGSVVNGSIIRELGPVLAATMIAGRVGCAMAAELGTMRVTEQIDALTCLGANPIHYLVCPRLLACVLLTPLLTIMADFMGVMGGALIAMQYLEIDAHQYWTMAKRVVNLWDINCGLGKSMVFGGAIAIISCYRGFNSSGGAEGVGRAATLAFVQSFIAILVLDFFMAMLFNTIYDQLWPR